jgi:hypothetical protein
LKGNQVNQRIIYQTDDGGVAVIVPCDCGLTIEEIAAKDVPTGRPYKIVAVADIPTDREWRDEWTVDEADLTDGVGA